MRARSWMLIPAVAAIAAGSLTTAHAAAEPKAATDFTLKDANGNEHTLSDQKGKWVILEWVNHDCPFVVRHYRSGNIPALQAKYREAGAVWFAICSSAPGTQGYFEGDALRARIEREKSVPTAYLIDSEGTVGRAYGARTTPQIVIINPEGQVVYNGGIDDRPRGGDDATCYVTKVMTAALAGEEIPISESRPYGCSVKYK